MRNIKANEATENQITSLMSLLAAGIAALVLDGLMGFANDLGAWLGCLITGFVVFCLSYMLYAMRNGQVQPWCGCEIHCFSARTCDPILDTPNNHRFDNHPANAWD